MLKKKQKDQDLFQWSNKNQNIEVWTNGVFQMTMTDAREAFDIWKKVKKL